MSNFNCEQCGTAIIDSPAGYVTGCEHYPIECNSKCEPGELCSCAWLNNDDNKPEVKHEAL